MALISLKITIHPNNKTIDGHFPVCVNILCKRQRMPITLNIPGLKYKYSLVPDTVTGAFYINEKDYPNADAVNYYLKETLNSLKHALNLFLNQRQTTDYTAKDVAKYLKPVIKPFNIPLSTDNKRDVFDNTDFFRLAQDYCDRKNAVKAHGSARCMLSIMRSLRAFKPRLALKNIDYCMLKDYETWYLSKGNVWNGLSINLRGIRTIYNEAIRRKIVPRDSYPFNDYRIKSVRTKKRAITDSDLSRIIDYLPACNTEMLARDLFLFSFYCAGINFKDMAMLTHRNIEGCRLRYERNKTGDCFNFPLNNACLDIIARHKEKCTGDYLLPIILQSGIGGTALETHIQNRRSRITHYMLRIGKKLELPINLTSYVARHTFATMAKKKNIPITVISELLGHEDIKTTQIYLASLESDVLDKYLVEITG